MIKNSVNFKDDMSTNTRHIVLECISAVMLCVTAFPLVMYRRLKGLQVPQHLTKGVVDIWADRSFFIYLFLIILALYALLSFVQRRTKHKKIGGKVIPWLKLWTMVWLAHLVITSYLIAIGKATSINVVIQWVIVICALIHLALIFLLKSDS